MLMHRGPRAGAAGEFTNNFKYNSGQGVQPVFEGWSWAPDGSINMHFGYLNRNYVEEPAIPVGPNNSIEPGGPDRGQPTFFYTRTQRNLFTVNVPKDWGKKGELIWTVTVNGKTERAVGWLQPEWEIDPVGGADRRRQHRRNARPTRRRRSRVTRTWHQRRSRRRSRSWQPSPTMACPKPTAETKPAVGQETPPTLQGGTRRAGQRAGWRAPRAARPRPGAAARWPRAYLDGLARPGRGAPSRRACPAEGRQGARPPRRSPSRVSTCCAPPPTTRRRDRRPGAGHGHRRERRRAELGGRRVTRLSALAGCGRRSAWAVLTAGRPNAVPETQRHEPADSADGDGYVSSDTCRACHPEPVRHAGTVLSTAR